MWSAHDIYTSQELKYHEESLISCLLCVPKWHLDTLKKSMKKQVQTLEPSLGSGLFFKVLNSLGLKDHLKLWDKDCVQPLHS